MFFIVLFLVNYFLILIFINSLYGSYFLLLVGCLYIYHINKIDVTKNMMIISIFLLLMTPLLIFYFDDEIYELYLFFNLDGYYVFIVDKVAIFLTILHSFIFYLGYNRKNNN
jgi:hypothetical protein